MSTSTKVLCALLVLLFGWLFLWTSLNSLGDGAWIMALVLAVVLAIASYFGLDWIGKRAIAREQARGQSILSPFVPAGETLRSMTYGYIGPGQTGMILLLGALGDALINSWRRKWYFIGLTDRSLILVQVKGNKPTGAQQVLPRGDVKKLDLAKGLEGPRLIVQLAAETLEIRISMEVWRTGAKTLVDSWSGLVPSAGVP